MSFLTIERLRKTYGTNVVVESFDLDVQPGEFVSFLGPSGCGKTTTLRMIAGFEDATSGTIRMEGRDVTHLPPNARNIGMVFQNYALFPNMTAAQNVAFGLEVAKKSASEISARVAEMLKLVKLPQLADRYPYQLSGGQQQRVALARALATSPKLLLLDEPLSGARRKGPGGASRRAQGAAAHAWHHDYLRDTRPGRGVVDVGPDRRDERRPG